LPEQVLSVGAQTPMHAPPMQVLPVQVVPFFQAPPSSADAQGF
jgi:hypothetical protein